MAPEVNILSSKPSRPLPHLPLPGPLPLPSPRCFHAATLKRPCHCRRLPTALLRGSGSGCDCDAAYRYSDCLVTRSTCADSCTGSTFLTGCAPHDSANGGACGRCQTWKTCVAATKYPQYQSKAGTKTTDRGCSLCPVGRATSRDNSVGVDTCLGIKFACTGRGYTGTWDRTLADKYAPTDCAAWSDCNPPFWHQTVAGNATSNRECKRCDSGHGAFCVARFGRL